MKWLKWLTQPQYLICSPTMFGGWRIISEHRDRIEAQKVLTALAATGTTIALLSRREVDRANERVEDRMHTAALRGEPLGVDIGGPGWIPWDEMLTQTHQEPTMAERFLLNRWVQVGHNLETVVPPEDNGSYDI